MAARPPAVRAAATVRPSTTVRPSAAMHSAHREMRCSTAVRAATTWAASDRAPRPAAAMRPSTGRLMIAAPTVFCLSLGKGFRASHVASTNATLLAVASTGGMSVSGPSRAAARAR